MRTGSFLALTVDPHHARVAEAELLRRFASRDRVSLEALLLREMRVEAETRSVKWPAVLAADADPLEAKGFRNLLRLAKRAAERVSAGLLALDRPALFEAETCAAGPVRRVGDLAVAGLGLR